MVCCETALYHAPTRPAIGEQPGFAEPESLEHGRGLEPGGEHDLRPHRHYFGY